MSSYSFCDACADTHRRARLEWSVSQYQDHVSHTMSTFLPFNDTSIVKIVQLHSTLEAEISKNDTAI